MRDDFRNAVRALVSSPSFTLVALLVLALGIGSATAIFSVVDAVALRGLPFDGYDRLGVLIEKDTQHAVTFGEGVITPQTYLDWRRLQQPFEAIGAASNVRFRLRTDNSEPADAAGQKISWEFLPVLRVAPMLGRAFTASDEAEGARRAVLLSYGFWQRRFGGAPDAVGRTIDLNEEPYDIVGVLPQSFIYPVGSDHPAEVFVPLTLTKDDRLKAGNHNYNYTVIGRLRAGVTFAQATDQMWRLSEQLDRDDPKWAPGRRARVVTLHEHLVGTVRGWMLMLLGAVVTVLLIACANVANLMLARATVRAREMGIRAALGASPWRLVRALLVEGLVLSLAGASLGMLLAAVGVRVLHAWLPSNLPRVAAIAIDLRILTFAVAVSVITGLVFGAVPAFQFAKPDVIGALKEGGRSATSGNGAQRLRSGLVVAEVALAVVLLVGAGLFAGSFVRLMRVDPGFDYHGVIAVNIGLRLLPGETFGNAFAMRNAQYARQVLDAVRRVPGALDAAEVSGGLPLTGSWSRTGVTLPGRGELKGEGDDIDQREVTPNYLQLLRVPLLKGRYIAETDRTGAPPVVVINQAAASKYWPGQDPLGQHITIDRDDRVVVGIVGNIHHLGPEVAPRQECYVPLAQSQAYGESIVVKTAGAPEPVLSQVKLAIWSVNREQRITADALTLERYMDRLIALRRFNMAVLALFGVLGLVIAAAGIYGVMAYLVAQRTTEIGVRMALGATHANVIAMVLRRAGLLVGLGLVIGGAGAWYLSTGVKAFLFDVQPNDLGIFAASIGVLATAALVATVLPARRAATVDPLIALRNN